MSIPCKWCGDPTEMMGTKECDPCHELYLRLSREALQRPEVLAKMLPQDERLAIAVAALREISDRRDRDFGYEMADKAREALARIEEKK